MQDRQGLGVKNRGTATFFKSGEQISLSASTFFNLFRIFNFLTLLDVALGNNPPNPFTFMGTDCYYSLSSDSGPGRKSWPAFVSIVNSLVTGLLGPITQTKTYVPADITIWNKNICEDGFAFQTNCSLTGSIPFSNNFIAMVNNDTAIQDLKNCGYWGIGNTIATIIALAICLAIMAWALTKIVGICSNECQRRDYDAIGGNENDAPKLVTLSPP